MADLLRFGMFAEVMSGLACSTRSWIQGPFSPSPLLLGGFLSCISGQETILVWSVSASFPRLKELHLFPHLYHAPLNMYSREPDGHRYLGADRQQLV